MHAPSFAVQLDAHNGNATASCLPMKPTVTNTLASICCTDFIGLSSYAPLPASLSSEAMEVSIQTAAFEFLYFGIDLKRLLFVDGKQLIYSEQGLGGLTDNGRLVCPKSSAVCIVGCFC